jgi:hypothetical protein
MSYFPALRNDEGETNILLVSTIIFGLVALVFSITSIFSVLDSQNSKHILNSAKQTSYKAGQDAQHQQDIKDQQAAAESPFRSYKAGKDFGNFEIKFPKNWNATVTENVAATNQVNLVLHPEIVKALGDPSQPGNNYAFRALLIKQGSDSLQKTLDDRVKAKKMTSKSVTVSGIAAKWYEGAWDDRHTGVMVLVPVRDKTIELITDYSKDYINEFNTILAQAVIPT